MQNNQLHRVTLNVVCYLVSATFLFSGFVKAIDPRGMAYKLDAYVNHLGIASVLEQYTLFWAIALAAVEFLIGVYLLFGIRRRLTVSFLFLMMVVFTPVTLWIALYQPVHDCGCFGDAITLSGWQSFAKNLVLLLMSVFLFKNIGKLSPLVDPSVHWAYSLYSMVYIVGIALWSVHYLPMIDWRPYKVGTSIRQAMTIPDGAKQPEFEQQFIMEKDGKRRTFTLNDYPDSTWRFVSRREVVKSKGYIPPITDFFIVDREGNDMNGYILNDTTLTFMLVYPNLDEANHNIADEVELLHDYCQDNRYRLFGVTASSESSVNEWCNQTGAAYPFYYADASLLKTMIRSNPGLIMMKDGTILNKWSSNALPLLYADDKRSEEALRIGITAESSLKVLIKSLLIYVIPLLFITLALRFRDARRQRRNKVSLANSK